MSMGTQPMPPSLIEILTVGKRTGMPDHNHSLHAT